MICNKASPWLPSSKCPLPLPHSPHQLTSWCIDFQLNGEAPGAGWPQKRNRKSTFDSSPPHHERGRGAKKSLEKEIWTIKRLPLRRVTTAKPRWSLSCLSITWNFLLSTLAIALLDIITAHCSSPQPYFLLTWQINTSSFPHEGLAFLPSWKKNDYKVEKH